MEAEPSEEMEDVTVAMAEEPPEEMEAIAIEDSHECPYCEKLFKGFRSLKTHIGHHFRKGDVRRKRSTCENAISNRKRKKAPKWGSLTQRVSCDICGTVCSNRHSLLRHHMIHTGQKPYKCETCGRSFTANWNLKMHKCTGHTSDVTIFTCADCGEEFSSETTFNDHVCQEKQLYQTPETGTLSSSALTSYGPSKEGATGNQMTFDCRFCDRTFATAKGLGGHMSIHRQQIDTLQSSTSFSTSDHETMNVEPTEEKGTFECQFCHRYFNSARGLARHANVHRTQVVTSDNTTKTPTSCQTVKVEATSVQSTWDCQFCDRVFTSAKGLGGHMSIHRPKIDAPENTTPSSLVNQVDGSEQTKWECHICKKVFSSHKGLGGHMSAHRFHTGSADHAASLTSCANWATPSPSLVSCTIQSPSPSLATPERINDEGPKQTKWECSYCQRIFTSPNALGGHMRVHKFEPNMLDNMSPLPSPSTTNHGSGDKPPSTEWECQFCAKLFFASNSLNEHLYQVHNYQSDIPIDSQGSQAPHECLICQRVFSNSMALGGHMSIHKLKRTVKQKSPKPQAKPNSFPQKLGKPEVPCTVCAKVYQYKASLKRHMSSHADELGPFRCPHCQVMHLLMDNLLMHMDVHQPNKCEILLNPPDKQLPLPETSQLDCSGHTLQLDCSNTEKIPRPTSNLEVAIIPPVVDNNGADWNPHAALTSPPMFSPEITTIEDVGAESDRELNSNLTVSPQQNAESDTKDNKEAFQMLEQDKNEPEKEHTNCFQCKICHQFYPKGLSFIRHKAWHTRRGDKPQLFKTHLESKPEKPHIPTNHRPKKTISGTLVNRFEKTAVDKTDNIQRVNISMRGHVKSVLYPCPLCNQKYTLSHNMQRHLKHAHSAKAMALHKKSTSEMGSGGLHIMNIESGSQEERKSTQGTGNGGPPEKKLDTGSQQNRMSTAEIGSEGSPQMKINSRSQQESKSTPESVCKGPIDLKLELGSQQQQEISDLTLENDVDSLPIWKRHKRGLFKCPICKREFTWYHNMRTHMKNLHHSTWVPATKSLVKFSQIQQTKFPPPIHKIVDGRNRIICGICKREFVNNSGFGMHMRVHKLKAAKSANLCLANNIVPELPQMDTIQYQSVMQHQADGLSKSEVREKQADTPGPHRYFCPTCNQGFFYYCRLKRHIAQHNSEGIFSKLPVTSPHAKSLVNHVSKFFYCRFCPRHFLNTGTLTNHEKWKHLHTGGNATHLLPILPKSHSYNDPYIADVNQGPGMTSRAHDTASGTQPRDNISSLSRFVCEMCNKAFSNQGNLMRHIKLHPSRKWLGPIASSLRKQYKEVVPHKLATVYQNGLPACGQCGKQFKAKSMLERHKRCHTGEKPFKCPVCAVCFTVSWSRLVHMRKTHPTYPTANLKISDKLQVRRNPYLNQPAANIKAVDDPAFPTSGKSQYYIQIINGCKVFCCPGCSKSFNTYQGLNGHKRHCSYFKKDRLNNTNNATPTRPILETLQGSIDSSYMDNVYDGPINNNRNIPWNEHIYIDINGLEKSSGCNTYADSNQYMYDDSNGYGMVRIKEEPNDDYTDYSMSNYGQNASDSMYDYAKGDNTVNGLGGSKVLDDAIGSMQALSNAIDKFAQSRELRDSDTEFDDMTSLLSDAEEQPSTSYHHTNVNGLSSSPNVQDTSYQSEGPSACNKKKYPDLSISYDLDDLNLSATDSVNIIPSTSVAAKADVPNTKEKSLVFKLLARKKLNAVNPNKALAIIKQSVLNDRLRGESGFVLGSIHSPLGDMCSDRDDLGYLIGHPHGFGQFCCPICHRCFPAPSLFANHLMFHVDKCPDASFLANVFRPANDPFHPDQCNCHLFGLTFVTCPKCVEGYTTLDDLKQHVKQHVEKFLECQAAELNL